MKLIITDQADPSVGMFPSTYEVECPFEMSDIDNESLDLFKDKIREAYVDYMEGGMIIEYDFEREASDMLENEAATEEWLRNHRDSTTWEEERINELK